MAGGHQMMLMGAGGGLYQLASAASASSEYGYGNANFGSYGSITPGSFRGHQINTLHSSTIPNNWLRFVLNTAALGASFFDSIRIVNAALGIDITRASADATYVSSSFSYWTWTSGTLPVLTPGYTFNVFLT